MTTKTIIADSIHIKCGPGGGGLVLEVSSGSDCIDVHLSSTHDGRHTPPLPRLTISPGAQNVLGGIEPTTSSWHAGPRPQSFDQIISRLDRIIADTPTPKQEG